MQTKKLSHPNLKCAFDFDGLLTGSNLTCYNTINTDNGHFHFCFHLVKQFCHINGCISATHKDTVLCGSDLVSKIAKTENLKPLQCQCA